MLLSREDFDHFARLYNSLTYFVNQRLEIVSSFPNPEAFPSLPIVERIKIRDELPNNIGLIDDFVTENPANLAPDATCDRLAMEALCVREVNYVPPAQEAHDLLVDQRSTDSIRCFGSN